MIVKQRSWKENTVIWKEMLQKDHANKMILGTYKFLRKSAAKTYTVIYSPKNWHEEIVPVAVRHICRINEWLSEGKIGGFWYYSQK